MKNLILKTLIMQIFFLAFISNCFADEIELKNGEIIKGEIIKETENNIIFKKNIGESKITVIFCKDEIKTITKDSKFKKDTIQTEEKLIKQKIKQPKAKITIKADKEENLPEIKEIQNIFDDEKPDLNKLTDFYKKIIEESYDLSIAYIELAKVYLTKKNIPKAAYNTEMALKYEKEPIDLYLQQMAICYNLLEKPEKAINVLKKIEEPTFQTYIELAYAYINLNNFDEAIKYLKKANSLKPNSIDKTYIMLAETSIYDNNTQKAIDYLKKSFDYNPYDYEFLSISSINPLFVLIQNFIHKEKYANAVLYSNEIFKLNIIDSEIKRYLLSLIQKESNLSYETIKNIEKSSDIDKIQLEIIKNKPITENNYQKIISQLQKTIELNPKATEAYIELGRVYNNTEQPDKAIEYLNKAIQLNPDIPEIYFQLGISYKEQNEYDKAIEYLNKAIQLDPEFNESYLQLAEILLQKNKITEAENNIQKAIEIVADIPENYLILGKIYNQKKEYNKAIESFKKVLDRKTDTGELYFELSKAYKNTQQHEKSVESLQKAFESNYDRFKLGKEYIKIQQYEMAIMCFEQAIQQEHSFKELYLKLAEAYRHTNNTQKAIEYLQKTIELDPQSTEAYIELGRVYNNTEQPDKAIEYLNKAIELDPKATEAYIELGKIYLKMDNFEKAIAYLQKSITLGTELIDPYINLITTHYKKGNIKTAINYIQKIEQRNFNLPKLQLYLKLGWAYNLVNKPNKAIHYLEEVISKNPATLQYGAYREMGKANLKLGEFNKSISYFKTFLKKTHNFPQGYINLANLFLTINKPEKAILWLNKGLENIPHSYLLYEKLGKVYIKEKKYMEAKQILQKGLNKLQKANIQDKEKKIEGIKTIMNQLP